MTEGKKLWLWKNGDHYLAFDNAYPCFQGGDPITLGEPLGIAFFHSSTDGTPNRPAGDHGQIGWLGGEFDR